jgi:hypothetical protein
MAIVMGVIVVGLMRAIASSMRASVGSMGAVIGLMAGSLMLEDDSKWLDGLILVGILCAAGRLDGADIQCQILQILPGE